MEASDVQRLKKLDEKNQRLMKMFADLSLVHANLKEVIAKKLGSWQQKALAEELVSKHSLTVTRACRVQ